MGEQTIIVKGPVAATDVSFEDYLVAFDGQFAEWVDGVVIQTTPISDRLDRGFQFLLLLIRAYLDLRPEACLFAAPYAMKASDESPAREPDLQILLNENLSRNTGTYIKGPCDLAIEIISPESDQRDRGEKFGEYEAAGVGEYWIIDPLRSETLFYWLGDDERYHRVSLDVRGYYHSSALSEFRFKPNLLWLDQLPGVAEVLELAHQMLAEM